MGKAAHTGIKRITALVLALVLCIPFAVPVRVYAEKREEITVMSNISEDLMEPYIKSFERKYPNISVKFYSYSDYEGEMKKNLESGKMGDVVFVPSFIGSDQYAQYFTNLGNYQELSEKYNYMEDSKHVGEKVYGIPSSAYVAGILYNKEVFDKAGITELPTTIDEFMQDLQMIKERTDAIPLYTNYSSMWTLQYWEMFPYLEMTGDPDYRYNGFLYQRNPFSQGSTHYQVFQMLYEIVAEGLCEENPKGDDWETSKRMLNQGKIGCMAMGSWAVQQFKNAGNNGDAVAFMPFPNNVDGKQYMTISTDYCYAINAESEHQESARAFIDYMLDESGYALDNQVLSLVKGDPYPDAYGDMSNVITRNNNAATSINYNRLQALSANLNLSDNAETARVIEAALGERDESFDDIMADWNARWESGRPADMEEEMVDDSGAQRFDSVIAEEYEVKLSETEKAFIKELGTIQVGYLKNLAPFQYEGEEGFQGLSQELCAMISDMAGISFSYVGFDNQAQLLEALQNGTIQMAAGLDTQDRTNTSLRFSKSYIDYMQVIVRNESTDVDNLQDKKEVWVKGNGMEESEDSTQDGKHLHKNTLADAIMAVDSGKADFLMGNYYCVDYYIKDMECEHVSVVPMSEKGSMSLAFSGGTDTRLISVCNKCLYEIPDSRIQVMLMDNLDPPVKKVTVERFIRSNPLLVTGIVISILGIVVFAIYMVMRQRWISARQHAVEMQRHEILATLMDEYVFEFDTQSKKIHFDSKFSTKFGVERDVLVEGYKGDNPCVQILMDAIEEAKVQNGEINSKPIEIRQQDGSREWYRVVAHTIRDNKGVYSHLIGKLVSAQKEVEEQRQMLDRAQRDPLTGLSNRDGFEQKYEKLKKDQSIVMAVLDLDNFKGVNDTLGHDGGDQALCHLAETMKRTFRENAITCRYGGDEFVICVYDTPRGQVETMLKNMVQKMDFQMEYQGKTRHLSISLGAVYASRKLPKKMMFRAADEILYQVKENGKNNWRMEEVEADIIKE